MTPQPVSMTLTMDDGSKAAYPLGAAVVTPPPVNPPPVDPPPATPPWATAPAIILAAGLANITRYTALADDYDFTGKRFPSAWAPADRTNNGYQATEYMAAQVQPAADGLHLVAEKKASPDGKPYSSGWVDTSQGGGKLWTHGLIEYRAKMPAGQGLWSGLWALGRGNPYPEIDIQEMLLGSLRKLYGSAHAWNGGNQLWGETQGTSLASDATGVQDYQLVWEPGLLTWAVNGKAYAQYSKAQAAKAGQTWLFDTSPMYLIANLAVAATKEWGGAPNASTTLPAALVLEHVRVWQ